MANTDGCCGGPNGKHLRGCNGTEPVNRGERRRRRKYDESTRRLNEQEKENARKFVRKKKYSTTYTPNPYPGVSMKTSYRTDGKGNREKVYEYVYDESKLTDRR